MSAPPTVDLPQIGQHWKRRDGREVLDIRRVWLWPGEGWTVRGHPIRGGKPLVCSVEHLSSAYELQTPAIDAVRHTTDQETQP